MRRIYLFVFASVLVYASCKKSTGVVTPEPASNQPVDTTTQKPKNSTDTPTVALLPVLYDNDNMLLGDPGNAQTNEDSTDNYLMRKTDYSESYNRDKGEPNWVSWHLYSADLGSVSRQDDFEPDDSLPQAWYHVTTQSYVGSGFDRGHNCPSGDRTSTTTANEQTYLMTNVIPQAPYNNQNTWNNMENYIRSEVNNGFEAYIIMGNYGSGGIGSSGYLTTTIDNGNVNVPAHIWKVVVLIQNGNNDTSRIDDNTRVIAVDVPNRNDVNQDWKLYRTSVDAIESSTGYDLLSRLPVAIQTVIEAKIDNQ